MSVSRSPVVTITVPADNHYFRSVRLAVGGLATMAGFDVEVIDDLRIGVDEICTTLTEVSNGQDLVLEIRVETGQGIRIDAHVPTAVLAIDEDRVVFSRQILSVVSDDYAITLDDGQARAWLERSLVRTRDAASGL